MKRVMYCCLIMIFSCFWIVGCSSKKGNSIVGTWTTTDEGSAITMRFYEDGSCINVPYRTDTSADVVSYKQQDDGMIIFTMEWDGTIILEPTDNKEEALEDRYKYCLSGDKLYMYRREFTRQDQEAIPIEEESDAEKISTENSEVPQETESDFALNKADDCRFSEDLAWIDRVTFKAIIDKDGKLLSRYTAGDSQTTAGLQVTPFSNGFASIKSNSSFNVVNTEGDIVSTYFLDDNNRMIAFGDGYTLMEEHNADFDTSEYIYRIYDATGHTIEEFKEDEPIPENGTYFCGKGMFCIGFNDFYSVNARKWTTLENAAHSQIQFYDDFAVVSSEGLTVMNTKGEVSERSLENLPVKDVNAAPVKNGVCVLRNSSEKYLAVYHFDTGEVYQIDASYAEKLNWESSLESLTFDNDRITLGLSGADEKSYVAVFDRQWNMIMEPIEYKRFFSDYCDDRMIVSTETGTPVYDENGEIVFSLEDKGYVNDDFVRNGYRPYENGVMQVITDDGVQYLDIQGKELLKHIETGSVKEIVVP